MHNLNDLLSTPTIPIVEQARDWILLSGVSLIASNSAFGMGDSEVYYHHEDSVSYVAVISSPNSDSTSPEPNFFGVDANSSISAPIVDMLQGLYSGIEIEMSPEMSKLADQAVRNQDTVQQRSDDELEAWVDGIVKDVGKIQD